MTVATQTHSNPSPSSPQEETPKSSNANVNTTQVENENDPSVHVHVSHNHHLKLDTQHSSSDDSNLFHPITPDSTVSHVDPDDENDQDHGQDDQDPSHSPGNDSGSGASSATELNHSTCGHSLSHTVATEDTNSHTHSPTYNDHDNHTDHDKQSASDNSRTRTWTGTHSEANTSASTLTEATEDVDVSPTGSATTIESVIVSNSIVEVDDEHGEEQEDGNGNGPSGLEDESRPNHTHTNTNNSNNSNNSSPPQIPKDTKPRNTKLITQMNMNPVQVPAPIGVRGRVVSLDRRNYVRHEEQEEEELAQEEDELSSSQNSSDDGSYFSEQHLSPKYDGKVMFPPRRGAGFGNVGNATNGNGLHLNGRSPHPQPLAFQRSRTYHYGAQGHPQHHHHKTHDSDLSLSSSSNDELTIGSHSLSHSHSQGNQLNNPVHLAQPYALMKTSSAPEPFRPNKPLRSLRPREDSLSDVDLDPVQRESSSVHGGTGSGTSQNHGSSMNGEMGRRKPPMSSNGNNNGNARDPLQVISSSEDVHSRPGESNRFSSSSSFVSSSSEDVITVRKSDLKPLEEDSKKEEGNAHAQAMQAGGKPKKHRRQLSHHSYTSVDSEQGSSVATWRKDEVDSELSDGDSFVKLRSRRGHHRHLSNSSVESRIPLEIPSPGAMAQSPSGMNHVNGSGSSAMSANPNAGPGTDSSGRGTGTPPISPRRRKIDKNLRPSGLNDEQLKAWRSGSSHTSSNSVVRNTSSSSLQSSAFLQYSEDDSDDTAKQQDFLLASFQGMQNSDPSDMIASGMGPVERRGGRSFGPDTKVELSSKPGPGPLDADQSSGPSVDRQSTSNASKSSRYISAVVVDDPHYNVPEKYTVYWQRWLMLMYISILNLLSDWTCYSVAPIAVLTKNAFGNINPEHLVTVFLASNALATAFEPMILSRLGLRKTIVFGSFLLMCGSVIKSGGIPGIIGTELTDVDAQWRIFSGFVLVGFSQPLYQCTPTLLSCSWFPEKERTFATGVALNSNQLGIGFAFVFGTMQVLNENDIPKYFGLLSSLSTLAFIGCFLQFRDAPPTPPSETARVIRGSLEVKIPYMDTMRQAIPASFRNMHFGGNDRTHRKNLSADSFESQNSNASKSGGDVRPTRVVRRKSRPLERKGSPNAAFKSQSRSSSSKLSRKSSDGRQRRRSTGARSATAESGLVSTTSSTKKSKRRKDPNRAPPSPSSGIESTSHSRRQIKNFEQESRTLSPPLSPTPTMRSQSWKDSRRLTRQRSADGRLRQSGKPAPIVRSPSADTYFSSGSVSPKKSSRKNNRHQRTLSSSTFDSPTRSDVRSQLNIIEQAGRNYGSIVAPSPMMNGRVRSSRRREGEEYYNATPQRDQGSYYQPYPYIQQPHGYGNPMGYGPQDQIGSNMYHSGHTPIERNDRNIGFPPDTPFANLSYPTPPMHYPNAYHRQPAPYAPYDSQPYYHQQVGPQYMQPGPHGGMYLPDFHPQQFMYPVNPMHVPPSQYNYPRSVASTQLPPTSVVDDGAEPILEQTGDNINIDIRDDQILRSIKACFSRKGFMHTVIAFAASGIVLNTLSTYMDYLVRLNGSGNKMVGIIGGSFQLLVMISSIIVGKFTDRTRAYYSVVIGLLVLGAFALAECGINLDAARGDALQRSLLLTALLIGPLQPISTELAVDVAFPLCSNTVLVIQQLVSNFCSAIFIPLFNHLSGFGTEVDGFERPLYTFSFYMLIVIHAVATVFFATFNGKYMRLAHEQKNKSDTRTRNGSGSAARDKYGPVYDEETAALV